jgi:DeoR/GlpR family transcriptional regulator of sugar metabolism
MRYARALSIEKRLRKVLELVQLGRYSTPTMAELLGVSVPTISRDLTALRERGHDIRAERVGGAWRFILASTNRKRPNEARNLRAEAR